MIQQLVLCHAVALVVLAIEVVHAVVVIVEVDVVAVVFPVLVVVAAVAVAVQVVDTVIARLETGVVFAALVGGWSMGVARVRNPPKPRTAERTPQLDGRRCEDTTAGPGTWNRAGFAHPAEKTHHTGPQTHTHSDAWVGTRIQ